MAADGIRLEIIGDGSDAQEIIRNRPDLLSHYEKNDPVLSSGSDAAAKPEDDFEWNITSHRMDGCEDRNGFSEGFTRIPPAPADRVLTLRKHKYQRSKWSSPEITWTIIWQKPGLAN